MTRLLLNQKVECNGGPFFKVVEVDPYFTTEKNTLTSLEGIF